MPGEISGGCLKAKGKGLEQKIDGPGFELKRSVFVRGDMAFLLIVPITPLLAMLPGRKGSCSDW